MDRSARSAKASRRQRQEKGLNRRSFKKQHQKVPGSCPSDTREGLWVVVVVVVVVLTEEYDDDTGGTGNSGQLLWHVK